MVRKITKKQKNIMILKIIKSSASPELKVKNLAAVVKRSKASKIIRGQNINGLLLKYK